ncbi:MAG: hypothetical protein K2Y14_09165 [Burkholderiales bacterium]|nr:hypothetical protein [Burkholderiales bacterium]
MDADLNQPEYDIFIKFIILYVSFNGYTFAKYGSSDNNQINKFSEDSTHIAIYNSLNENSEFNTFYNYVNNGNRAQKNCGGVRSCKYDKLYKFNSANKSLHDYMKAIYAVRCNLFHGSKDLDVDNDKLIVTSAYTSFKVFIEKLAQSHDAIETVPCLNS